MASNSTYSPRFDFGHYFAGAISDREGAVTGHISRESGNTQPFVRLSAPTFGRAKWRMGERCRALCHCFRRLGRSPLYIDRSAIFF